MRPESLEAFGSACGFWLSAFSGGPLGRQTDEFRELIAESL
jgi:hypothetical protein